MCSICFGWWQSIYPCLVGFLQQTLLYCDDNGNLYQVKTCPYVKRQLRRKEVKHELLPKERISPKPVKYMYTPPEHVHQFIPDYSMLSLSKPKKKKRKGDDLTVWCGGVGSASFKKRPKLKKKKKQVCLVCCFVIVHLSLLLLVFIHSVHHTA